jgi:hypothetical protein
MITLDLPPGVDEARARLLLALGLFQEGEVSVGKAAEIAGLRYRAFERRASPRDRARGGRNVAGAAPRGAERPRSRQSGEAQVPAE